MRLAGMLVLLAPTLVGAAAVHFHTTARQELERLQRRDGDQYASALYDSPEKWSYVSEKIATGQPEWLQVAKALSPRADGAFAEELSTDLASALLHSPRNVLQLLKQTSGSRILTSTNVCDAPFPSPGKQWLRQYKWRVIKSVSSIREPELKKVRNECLKTLHSVDLSGPASAYE